MIETWFINGEVVYHGPYCPYEKSNSRPGGGLAYAFYDQNTGEVWGKRLCLDSTRVWIYIPQEYPDIRLPYEWTQQFLPDSYFLFLIEYLFAQSLTMQTEEGILHPNNPNHLQELPA